MKVQEIKPLEKFEKISLKLPTSKSLTQRALICSALAEGVSKIIEPLKSEDTLLLKSALENIGIKIEEKGNVWEVEGRCPPLLSGKRVFLGNNGTGARFFIALASLGRGSYVEIYGKPRLHERPMGPLIESLSKLSANIECLEKEGFLPVKIKESHVISQDIFLPGNISSQFISALLLIGPYLPKGLKLIVEGDLVSKAYIDLTLDVMKAFGVEVKFHENIFEVPNSSYRPTIYEVEADASTASYFLALPLILGKGKVVIENYNPFSKQGDVKFLEYIRKMGAKIEMLNPLGVSIEFEGVPKGVEIDLSNTPDLFPTMCVLGAVAEEKMVLRGAPHLRYKETDRIKAMVTELRKLGVKAEELPDGAIIEGTQTFKSATINTYDDHRIAMSFAILGLKTGGLKIKNPQCVAKSFPDFWEYLEKLYG
ncbi:MAG TPA: 3-phosphoshikimate 1-carboxyvinyltransferase [Thermodesulfobacterium geofontis]|nr:3-phosphoshikimate 1-carboxyvinyltransferase [Thermodesulfobacterium geofontis]